MATVYENRDFLADLDSGGHAVRSVVYCADVATIWVYEWTRSGLLTESQKHYPAERVPEHKLKNKFRRRDS